MGKPKQQIVTEGEPETFAPNESPEPVSAESDARDLVAAFQAMRIAILSLQDRARRDERDTTKESGHVLAAAAEGGAVHQAPWSLRGLLEPSRTDPDAFEQTVAVAQALAPMLRDGRRGVIDHGALAKWAEILQGSWTHLEALQMREDLLRREERERQERHAEEHARRLAGGQEAHAQAMRALSPVRLPPPPAASEEPAVS